jgi:hypothetical protein
MLVRTLTLFCVKVFRCGVGTFWLSHQVNKARPFTCTPWRKVQKNAFSATLGSTKFGVVNVCLVATRTVLCMGLCRNDAVEPKLIYLETETAVEWKNWVPLYEWKTLHCPLRTIVDCEPPTSELPIAIVRCALLKELSVCTGSGRVIMDYWSDVFALNISHVSKLGLFNFSAPVTSKLLLILHRIFIIKMLG